MYRPSTYTCSFLDMKHWGLNKVVAILQMIFQSIFLEILILYFDSNFTKFVPEGPVSISALENMPKFLPDIRIKDQLLEDYWSFPDIGGPTDDTYKGTSLYRQKVTGQMDPWNIYWTV